MKIARQLTIKLTAITVLATLGGCLSDDVETTENTGAPPPPGPTNSAPTISGNPSSAITVDVAYTFTPQASDADGDTLTFSVQNLPTWASFESTSGRISGTPTLGDVGVYSNISVSVSDGQASDSISAFSIDVTQVATASTTVSWTAPTLNDDGTTLTDLSGYNIYYGRSSGNYTNEINIDNASVTTFVVDNLSPDTYYFAATALNSSGGESRFSGEAIKVVN